MKNKLQGPTGFLGWEENVEYRLGQLKAGILVLILCGITITILLTIFVGSLNEQQRINIETLDSHNFRLLFLEQKYVNKETQILELQYEIQNLRLKYKNLAKQRIYDNNGRRTKKE